MLRTIIDRFRHSLNKFRSALTYAKSVTEKK